MCIAQFDFLPDQPETLAQRVRRLQAEARLLAAEHVEELEIALMQVARISAEIVEGGDIYPPGVQDISTRLSGDAAWSAQTLAAILHNVVERRAARAD